MRRLIEANPVREQGWRSARGLQRVAEKYDPGRTERACARALFFGARSYKPVAKMLSLGRESLPLPHEEPSAAPVIDHENVRSSNYFPPLNQEIEMLNQPTIDKLHSLRMPAMANAWLERARPQR